MKRWKSLLSLLCLLTLLAAVAPAAVDAATGPQAMRQQQAPDSGQDWPRVQDAGKIVIGTSADYEPFEFYNSNFALDGFDIALMQELAKRMGVEVEFKDFAFDGLLDALELGQVDAAIGAVKAAAPPGEAGKRGDAEAGDLSVSDRMQIVRLAAHTARVAGSGWLDLRSRIPDSIGKVLRRERD